MNFFLKRLLYFTAALAVIYLLLLIPDSKEKNFTVDTGKKPFTWNSDSLWLQMEEQYRQARQMDNAKLDSLLNMCEATAEFTFALLKNSNIPAQDSIWVGAENNFFRLASLVAVKQDQIPWLTNYYTRFRNLTKERSQHWDMNQQVTRNTVYTLLYGMRAAAEETLLQADSMQFP